MTSNATAAHAVATWVRHVLEGNPPGQIPGGLDGVVQRKMAAVSIAYDTDGMEAAVDACEKLGLDAEATGAGAAEDAPGSPMSAGGTDEFHQTDLGNARRLVRDHSTRFRFCAALGGWLHYDGQRWSLDSSGEVERAAKSTALTIYSEAGAFEDRERRERWAKWALASESAARLDAMVRLAQTEAEVVATPHEFDGDAWSLNVSNGTIDLRTGHLRPHDPADRITKLAPVVYDAAATSPLLERLLEDATGGDADFHDYLQRAAGYTLVGVTSEEAVFLLLGPGGSGKSTFVEMMLAALGDYGVKATFATFLASRGGGGGEARPDLMAMRGARLVVAAEPARGRAIDAGLVKELSGGDSITARALYAPVMTFAPTFTIWLAANAAPTMPDDDTGLWRRLKTLPFEHAVPEPNQDPEIKEHLTRTPEGRAAVLAWAVKGCLAWHAAGRLKPPKAVLGATEDLRIQFDPLAEFFDEQCEFESSAATPAKRLRAAYEGWADEQGAKAINNREWGDRLRRRGCLSKRTGTSKVTVWCGIRLAARDDES